MALSSTERSALIFPTRVVIALARELGPDSAGPALTLVGKGHKGLFWLGLLGLLTIVGADKADGFVVISNAVLNADNVGDIRFLLFAT